MKEAKDQQKFLVNQTRKVNNEYTRARRREEEAERDKVKLRERINTVEMESNAVELDLKQYTEEEQEAMVEQISRALDEPASGGDDDGLDMQAILRALKNTGGKHAQQTATAKYPP